MIQDTTLRMVVRAVDEATAPLLGVKASLDDVTGGLEGVQKTATEALPTVGKEAADVADELDDLGKSARGAASMLGPPMVEAAVVAGLALVSLVNYLRDLADEHKRVEDLAQRFSLPYEVVDRYSESWQGVAASLEDAARGFAKLKDAQARGLEAIGVTADGAGGLSALTKIAAATGTRQEKIDALRIISGKSYDEVATELDGELRRLGEIVSQYRDYYDNQIAVTRAQVEGVKFGQVDVSQLLRSGALIAPENLNKENAGRKELEKVQAARVKGVEDANKEIARLDKERERAVEVAARLAEKSAKEQQRLEDSNYKEFEKAQDARRKSTEQLVKEQEAAAKATAKDWNDAWSDISKATDESLRATFKGLIVPVNEFVESWKDAMKDMVYFGDFSFKRLVARIVVNLTSKELFSAIDKVGDALSDAFNKSGSGGGGFLKGVGSFLGSLFGGKAGGGRASGLTWVGEDGAELVDFGSGGRVYNQRQLAFAGAGGAGSTTTVVNNHNYSISGVETQQVVAYIEQTRRQDQKANIKMLERNGLGRMR